jgi:hypothetical protein
MRMLIDAIKTENKPCGNTKERRKEKKKKEKKRKCRMCRNLYASVDFAIDGPILLYAGRSHHGCTRTKLKEKMKGDKPKLLKKKGK